MGVADGEQVLTNSGNVYEYNAEKNEWVCIGIIPDHDVVSLENNGLISPNLYRKLTLIQELIDQGFDFNNFKLDTDVQDPYYYFFHSSDDLVKFTPEKCLEPKEVRTAATVTSVVDNGDGSSTITLDIEFASDYSKLVLETLFCSYNIISSDSDNSELVIDSDRVNILSGDTVKIVKPEELTTKLRIEIDKGRLYRKLIRNCCVGPKGVTGNKGDTGTAGVAASNEVFQLPSDVTGGSFSWSATVETPIETPISLRIFGEDDSTVLVEIIQPLDNSTAMVVVNSGEIVVEETPFESFFDPTSGLFTGSLTISSGQDISAWRFKVRQTGPKGPAGTDGSAFLQVVTSLLEDTSVRSTDAVVSLRRGTVDGDIVIFRSNLFEEIPVSNLSAVGGSPISDILADNFVAVNATIEESKDIGFYQFSPKDFEAPELDIPLWTPTADCVQNRRWAQYRFDWFNKTEPDYLYSILLNPRPPEQCCQEDFFFCPNVGDNPCGITGEVKPPVPSPVECICVCENPLANEFIGGNTKVFSPMDLTSDEASVASVSESAASAESDENVAEALSTISLDNINIVGDGGSENLLSASDVAAIQLVTVESVIDGVENNFVQDIKLVGNGEIIVSLDYDADPCGGPVTEREDCAFVDSNAVRTMFTLTDRSGTASISGGGVLEAATIPTTVAFTVAGMRTEVPADTAAILAECSPGETATIENGKELTPADLQLKVSVNTTEVNYCRGYRITIIALSDETDESCPPIVTKIPIQDPPRQAPDSSSTSSLDPAKPQCSAVEASTFIDEPVDVVLQPQNTSLWDLGSPVLYQITKDPSNGTVTGTAPNLVYTPNSGFTGQDSFQYVVGSAANPRNSDPCTVTIDVATLAPEASFASDGRIIESGDFVNQKEPAKKPLSGVGFVQQYPISLVSVSGTGDNTIFINWANIDIGELIKAPSPSQTPLVFDGLQDNTVISINDVALNKVDAGYDDGPLGVGTYVLGDNFTTYWGSRIPNIDVRRDTWTDVVTFFSEPQEPGDKFRVVVLARLDSSVLLDSADSVYANELFESGFSDGVFVFSGVLRDDPMKMVRTGTISFIEEGLITVSYDGDVTDIYPRILIEPATPETPAVTLPPGISDIDITLTDSSPGAESDITFSFFINNDLPKDAQICIDFPEEFDISGVDGLMSGDSPSSGTIDGTFTATKDGSLLMIRRSNDGSTVPGESTVDITIESVVNPLIAAETYTFDITTKTVDSVIIDGPATSPAVTII